MTAYRKKPVVIEATQWFKNGDHPLDGSADPRGPDHPLWEGSVVRYYRHPDVPGERPCEQCGKTHHVHGWIDTLEQGHRVCPGDWIITGVKNERYPCKPDIFAATYELAATPQGAQTSLVGVSEPSGPEGLDEWIDTLTNSLNAGDGPKLDVSRARSLVKAVLRRHSQFKGLFAAHSADTALESSDISQDATDERRNEFRRLPELIAWQKSEQSPVEKALRRAYSLGQTYWQQADSESYSQNRKSDETAAKFEALVAENIAATPQGAPASPVGAAEPWSMPSGHPALAFINTTPILQSLLYDINLLPEQIADARRWGYMLAVCSHLKAALSAQPASPATAPTLKEDRWSNVYNAWALLKAQRDNDAYQVLSAMLGWEPGAAKPVEPAPQQYVRIDFKQATDLLAMFGGEPAEITLQLWGGEGHDGPGLYAWYTDYPEEGSINLGVTDEEAAPALTPHQPIPRAYISHRACMDPVLDYAATPGALSVTTLYEIPEAPQAETGKLREALQEIADMNLQTCGATALTMAQFARAALEAHPKEGTHD